MVKCRMDAKFLELEEHVRAIVSKNTQPGEEESISALLDTWKALHANGVEGFNFAHMALLMAEAVMTFYEPLDCNLAFGEYLQRAGASKIRCTSTHWPPIDQSAWPDRFPKDMFPKDY